MSPHPSLSFNHLQQYNWAQSLRLTVGLSLNVPLMPVLIGASMVLNPAARCCLLPDTLYVLNGCFRCLPSCIVFMHYRLHAPPLLSSFKGWVSRFFFTLYVIKKKLVSPVGGENILGEGKLKWKSWKSCEDLKDYGLI